MEMVAVHSIREYRSENVWESKRGDAWWSSKLSANWKEDKPILNLDETVRRI